MGLSLTRVQIISLGWLKRSLSCRFYSSTSTSFSSLKCGSCGKVNSGCGLDLIKCASCGIFHNLDISKTSLFDAFCLPHSFSIDTNLLRAKFISMQRVLHPDNFGFDKISASGNISASNLEVATRWSSWLNSAYETLKDPYLRALYYYNYMTDQDFQKEKVLDSSSLEEDHEILTTVMTERMVIEDSEDLAEISEIRKLNTGRRFEAVRIFHHF